MFKLNKKAAILLILVLILLALIGLFAYKSKLVHLNRKEETKATSSELKTNTYQKEMKDIISQYEAVLVSSQKSSTTLEKDGLIERVNLIKNNLMEIKVPEEFKEMHLNLFFSVLSLEKFLKENKAADLQKSEDIFKNTKKENNWLYEI